MFTNLRPTKGWKPGWNYFNAINHGSFGYVFVLPMWKYYYVYSDLYQHTADANFDLIPDSKISVRRGWERVQKSRMYNWWPTSIIGEGHLLNAAINSVRSFDPLTPVTRGVYPSDKAAIVDGMKEVAKYDGKTGRRWSSCRDNEITRSVAQTYAKGLRNAPRKTPAAAVSMADALKQVRADDPEYRVIYHDSEKHGS